VGSFTDRPGLTEGVRTVSGNPVSAAARRELVRIAGEQGVLDNPEDLKAFSYDAGIYRVNPAIVVLPQNAREATEILHFAAENGISLTLRSGGTNLGGGSIGPGIVMGLSRLNSIDLSGISDGYVEVGPGVILKELNDQLAQRGYFFAPDPSSGLACQIGGMIGTNAAGAHSLKYGAVKENVLGLDFVPVAGDPVWLSPMPVKGPPEEWRGGGGMPRGFESVLENLPLWAPVLKKHRKNVSKNASGYNLFDLADRLYPESNIPPVWDPLRLVIGSEGTLGLVTKARLLIRSLPFRKSTILAFFYDLLSLGGAVAGLQGLGPSALEMMDRTTLDLVGREKFSIPPDADSLLLIEFDHEPQDELLKEAMRILSGYPSPSPARIARSERDQAELWKARHALFPTLYRYDGVHRPINFADDVAVPVHRLPELLEWLRSYFKGAELPVAIYGHIGNGNAHINPLLNLAESRSMSLMLDISRTVHRTVIERFEGVPCGEHGEGRVRAEFLPEVYGPEVYRIFEKTKGFFDPEGVLNPGIKISRTSFLDNIDVARVVQPCATCGKCNTVCPSFDVLRQESMGARGWYQILTDPAFRDHPPEGVLDGCLNCKSCRTVCPAGVDVSAVVLEARSRFRSDPLTRAISRTLLLPGRLTTITGWLGRTQPAWDRPLFRKALEEVTRLLFQRFYPSARIPSGLALPRLRSTSLRRKFRELTEEGGRQGDLAYFHGCAANTLDDGVGESMIRLLGRAAGRRLVLPSQTCSGTPIETYGHKDLVREAARQNLTTLQSYGKIVTGCASCTLALRDLPVHFPEGSGERERAGEISRRVVHVSQFMLDPEMAPVLREIRENADRESDGKRVTYHASCHLRAAGVVDEPHDLLEKVLGERFHIMQDEDRCAGGAGTYLLKNPEFSREIFARKEKAVRESRAHTVTTSCPACQMTLRDRLGDDPKVSHLAVLLSRYLSPDEKSSFR